MRSIQQEVRRCVTVDIGLHERVAVLLVPSNAVGDSVSVLPAEEERLIAAGARARVYRGEVDEIDAMDEVGDLVRG